MDRKRRNEKFIIRCLISACFVLSLLSFDAKAAGVSREDRILILLELEDHAGKEPGSSFEFESEELSENGAEFKRQWESELETGTEMESETESETAGETKTDTALISGNGLLTESETESEDGFETEFESAAGTESVFESESENETEPEPETLVPWSEGELTIPEDLENRLALLTGIEPESETEEETEPLSEELDEAELAAAQMLEDIQLGEDFRIPMQMPEETGILPEFPYYHCGKLPMDQLFNRSRWKEDRVLSDLESTIRNMLLTYDGEWSVYVKNLNTDEDFIINDIPMKSASIMKLFIMGTVYTEIEKGNLERTDNIDYLLNRMITYSDNEASNELLYILGNSSYSAGIAKVNAFISEYGYSDMTVEYNGFSNPATVMGDGTNQVAAKDVGLLLEDIYRRTWMNRAASNEVESMMLNQDTRYKIPAGLPDGVLCGNKTGEMDGTENDAAIVYSDNCDYILVILSSDWASSDTAVARIRNLSELTYEFFND